MFFTPSLFQGLDALQGRRQPVRELRELSKAANYPAMSFFFVCWHSRKWWPPICGGTLQSALSRLEKVQWTNFFCNNGISHTNCPWKGKKHDKKSAKSLQKRWGFQNFWNEGSLQIGIPKWRDPSKSEFRNGGIAQADGQQMALLAAVSKVVNSPIFHICCKHQNSSMQFRICESLVILVKHW